MVAFFCAVANPMMLPNKSEESQKLFVVTHLKIS